MYQVPVLAGSVFGLKWSGCVVVEVLLVDGIGALPPSLW
jgi:hypothetical protein